jgi:hypothetical protein
MTFLVQEFWELLATPGENGRDVNNPGGGIERLLG